MFETTGIINEEIVNQLKKHLISAKLRKLVKILVGISILLAIVCIFINKVLIVILLVLPCILIGTYYYSINKCSKIIMQRMEETTGKKETSYKVYFDEVGVVVNNLDTGGKGHMKYDLFTRFVEVEDVYAIFTKASQFVVIFKNSLEVGKANEFELFIKKNCKNLE